jgi:type I restriction enzyme S subunit
MFPETWPLIPVGELFDTQLGKMLSQKAHGGGDPKPYLRNKNVQWGKIETSDVLVMDFNEREKEKFKLVPGDLLMCEGGVVGRAAIWNGEISECYYQKALHRLRPSNGSITNEFMLYWMRFAFEIRNFYGVSGASSTIAHLPAAQLQALEVPLPPLPEQKKIAHILSSVQRTIEAQERIIQITTELKRALMHKLFTEGLRREPPKETEIGPMPQNWEVVELGKLAKVGNGSTPKRTTEAFWERGTIPWLNSTKIHDRFITEADQFVTPQAFKECHLPKVAPNSLLIAITGQGKTLGNCAITRIETCINQHLAYAQFHSAKTVPDFVFWFMQTRYDYLRSIAHGGGSTKGALTCGFLKTLPIPVPPRTEQEAIVTVFQTLEEKQVSAVRKQAALQGLFRSLLHELMSANTRVHELQLSA